MLNKRNGLPQAAEKILSGQPLCIAYIGGSNTVMKESWRVLFHPWMDFAFPAPQPHTEINLSIGAIGTLAASFLIPENLKGTRPDLAIIEYSINDFNWMSWEGEIYGEGTQPAASVSSSLEGVVRMVRRENPDCDILFLHMPLRNQLNGTFPVVSETIRVYEAIADYYGIPSLFAVAGFQALENSGRIKAADYETALFSDAAHLSPFGLTFLMEMFDEAMKTLLAESGPSAALPQPMNSLTTEFAYPMPVEPWMIEGPFTEERFHNSRFDVPYFSLPAGSRLKIDYKGALVGLGIVFGPDTPGVYKAVLNGRTSNLSLFTHYCSKPHLGSIILNKDLSDPNQHGKLTCEAMPVYPDYAHTRKYTPLPVPIPIENLRLNITHLMLLGKALQDAEA